MSTEAPRLSSDSARSAVPAADPRASLFLLLLAVIYILAVAADVRLLLPAVFILSIAWRFSILASLLRRLLLVLPMSIGIALFVMLRAEGDDTMFRFASLTITRDSLTPGIIVLSRMLLISAASLLFGLVIPMRSVVAAMHAFKIPSTVVSVAWMTERYFSLLATDSKRMLDSVRARSIRLTLRMRISVAARMAAAFLTRAVQRSERLADAMLARGFNGRIPSDLRLHWSAKDTMVCCAGMVFLTLLWLP